MLTWPQIDRRKKQRLHWTQRFSPITPVLVTISLFMLGGLLAGQSKLEERLFKHFTNDEMHTPRSLAIMRPEFQMYQAMRDQQMADIKNLVIDIKADLKCALKEKNNLTSN